MGLEHQRRLHQLGVYLDAVSERLSSEPEADTTSIMENQQKDGRPDHYKPWRVVPLE